MLGKGVRKASATMARLLLCELIEAMHFRSSNKTPLKADTSIGSPGFGANVERPVVFAATGRSGQSAWNAF